MKDQILKELEAFKRDLATLRKQVRALTVERVSKKALRDAADELATRWVEKLRSPLEHKFKLPSAVIDQMAVGMKRLHVLSRPNNQRSSYLEVLDEAVRDFDDQFILPIKQSSGQIERVLDLEKLIPGQDAENSDYLKEAIDCAAHGFKRAAVVMGWCAAVDRMRTKVAKLGFDRFSAESKRLKAQTSGRFKHFNKEFTITSNSELQTVFDTDLIRVLEGLGIFDMNQSDRLIDVLFQLRNHSAHPGSAPVDDPNLVAFFSDVTSIVLKNTKLD